MDLFVITKELVQEAENVLRAAEENNLFTEMENCGYLSKAEWMEYFHSEEGEYWEQEIKPMLATIMLEIYDEQCAEQRKA